MNAIITTASKLQGRLSVPPDKSIVHRIILLAAVAAGTTTIRPWPSGDDCQRTLQLIEQLGVSVRRADEAVTMTGCGGQGLTPPTQPLACGESGTTLRLAAGLLAGQPFVSQLTAAPSLSRRPMRRIVEPLTRMGVTIEGRKEASQPSEIFPPLTIHGRRPLQAIRYELSVASAQVKSAVLLAGLSATEPTTIIERQPTRDHTERALRRFGLTVHCQGGQVTLTPGSLRAPGLLEMPGDCSSAAFFLVAAACLTGSRVEIERVSLNPTRTAYLAVLRRMGASVSIEPVVEDQWEPQGTVTVESRPLRAVTVAPEEIPSLIDELPILMVAATSAQGTSRFEGLAELRVKETDRLRSMAEGLSRMGARVRVRALQAMEIDGGLLTGSAVDSAGDHRTAMSLAVAGLIARGTTVVRGAECVAKSLPDFFERLTNLVGGSTVKTVDKA